MIDPKLREDDAPRITDRMLRQFAGLCIFFFGGLSVLEGYSRHRSGRALVFALLAATMGGVGLIRPRAIRPVFTTALMLTAPIGWVVSRLLLAAIFFIVITPLALLFRLLGRDALSRRRNMNARTYWRKREPPSDPLSYLHQS
jgi:Saxitoxin biosynthesis operon protein SxtJ